MHFQHSVLRLTLAVLAGMIVAPQHILPDVPETSLISLLILLASVLFILEMKITSYGLLSMGGIISLLLGSIMLFDVGKEAGLQLSMRVLVPTVVLVSGFFTVVASLAFKAQISKIRTGAQGLVGETGVAQTRLSPRGKIFVHGEIWNAIADETIAKGANVQVIGVENLVAKVKLADG